MPSNSAEGQYKALTTLPRGGDGQKTLNWLFLLCTVSALLIGIALLAFRPDLYYFAGASGAAVAYCASSGLSTSGPWRAVCLTVLVLLVGKISLEFLWPGSSLVGVSGDFVVVPLSHAVGAASGLLMFSWWRWRDTKGRDNALNPSSRHASTKISLW